MTSEALLAELAEVLARPHLEARPLELRDLEDLPVLLCAVGGLAQAIVSGDKDLLVPKDFQGVVITTPRLFLSSLGL